MTRGRPSFAHASPSRPTRAARAGWSLVTPSPARPCSRASYTGLASMSLPGSALVPGYPVGRVPIHGPASASVTPVVPTTALLDGRSGGEGVRRADRVGDEGIGQHRGEPVLGLPAGAVRRDEDVRREFGE